MNLLSFFPLPAGVVLEWRRLTACLTKAVFLLQKERAFNDAFHINAFRINGYWISHVSDNMLLSSNP